MYCTTCSLSTGYQCVDCLSNTMVLVSDIPETNNHIMKCKVPIRKASVRQLGGTVGY